MWAKRMILRHLEWWEWNETWWPDREFHAEDTPAIRICKFLVLSGKCWLTGPYTVQKPLFWATYSAQNGVKISHLIENFTLKSMQWSELKSSNYSFFYSSLRIVTNCMHETSLSRIFLLVYPVSGLSQSRLPLIRASWISISNWNRGRTAAPPNRQVNRRGGLTRPIVNQWARLAMSLNLQFSGNAMRNVGEKDDFEALRMMGMEWNLVTW